MTGATDSYLTNAGGATTSDEVLAAAAVLGFGRADLHHARQALGVTVEHRYGYGRHWIWGLAQRAANSAANRCAPPTNSMPANPITNDHGHVGTPTTRTSPSRPWK